MFMLYFVQVVLVLETTIVWPVWESDRVVAQAIILTAQGDLVECRTSVLVETPA